MADELENMMKSLQLIIDRFQKVEKDLPRLLDEAERIPDGRRQVSDVFGKLQKAFHEAMPELNRLPGELLSRKDSALAKVDALRERIANVNERREEFLRSQPAPVPVVGEADLKAAPSLSRQFLDELRLDKADPGPSPAHDWETLESWAMQSSGARTPQTPIDSVAAMPPTPRPEAAVPPDASKPDPNEGMWSWANASSRVATDQKTTTNASTPSDADSTSADEQRFKEWLERRRKDDQPQQ